MITQKLLDEYNAIFNQYLQGYVKYQQRQEFSYCEREAIWQQGSARLLKINSKPGAKILLAIPPLINKSFILDLLPEFSFLQYLGQDHEIYLLDWYEPNNEEGDFGVNDYVTNRIIPAIEFLNSYTRKQTNLLGYCMGGIMSIAAANLRPSLMQSLMLLATPWSFDHFKVKSNILQKQMLEAYFKSNELISPEFIKNIFIWSDPQSYFGKFNKFNDLLPNSLEERKFIAIESWLNQGLSITSKLAKECFIDWVYEDSLLNWSINDKQIMPENIAIPTLVIKAELDKIVPPPSVDLLLGKIKHAHVESAKLGHIGIIASHRAPLEIWQKINKWLTLTS